jgi:D-arabinose 1-dehydrogenase-like Zn-dependent alcohol dehydrogenase
MASASLCHSNLMSIGMCDRKDPFTIGHEGARYFEKLHPSTEGQGFKIGDAVGFRYVQRGCYECRGCMVHRNHCIKRQSHVNGFTIPGLFAECSVVGWQNCVKLPESVTPATAAPFFALASQVSDATLRPTFPSMNHTHPYDSIPRY